MYGVSSEFHKALQRLSHRKKRFTSFPSSAGMALTKLSYDVIIPAQGEFGSDIPAVDGKLANLFLRCRLQNRRDLQT
jgi:hypothetical protein